MKPFRGRTSLASSLVPLLVVSACGGASPNSQVDRTIPLPEVRLHLAYTKGSLSNGLRFAVLPDLSTNLVKVDVRYEVGANEDPADKPGLAHFVEHATFLTGIADGDAPARPLQEHLLDVVVDHNGYTTADSTHYTATAPAGALDRLLQLEGLRALQGCRKIDPAEFQREREVVRNEIRERHGSPEGEIPLLLREAVYPVGHPYRHDAGGEEKAVADFTPEEVCAFFEKYYVPSRMTVVVTGNTSDDAVEKALVSWFRAVPKRDGAPRVVVTPPVLKGETVKRTLDVDQARLVVAWRYPGRFDADEPAAQTVTGDFAIKLNGFAHEYGFASDVDTWVTGEREPLFVVSLDLTSPDKADEAIDAVWKASASIAKYFDEEYARRTQRRMFHTTLTSFDTFLDRGDILADYTQFKPEATPVVEALDRISATDEPHVRRVANTLLLRERSLTLLVTPDGSTHKRVDRGGSGFGAGGHAETRLVTNVDASEADRPFPLAFQSASTGATVATRLENGMKVIMMPSSNLPVVNVRLVFGSGAAQEPKGLEGVASTAAFEMEAPDGAVRVADWRALETLYRIGATRDTSVDDDSTVFAASGLESDLGRILLGLERSVRPAEYDQEQVERSNAQRKTSISQPRAQLRTRVAKAFYQGLFGPRHPYAAGGFVTPQSLDHVGRDAAQSFKDRHYNAANATLIITGWFNPKGALAVANDVFGGWSSGDAPAPIPAATLPTKARYLAADAEEQSQVEVSIGFPTVAGIDGSYAGRLILQTILDARLRTVREGLGASYGVQVSYVPNAGPGLYLITANVDASRAAEAIVVLRRAIDSVRRGENLAGDFVLARRAMVRWLLAKLTDSQQLAASLSFVAARGFGPDFYSILVDEVAKRQVADVRALVGADLSLAHEVMTLVGPREEVEEAYGAAGIRGVEWVK